MSSSPPFRIGLHGLDSFGLYHLQQLSLRPDFELVAVTAPPDLEVPWPENREPGGCHSDLGHALRENLEDLLRENLDAVILSNLPDQPAHRIALIKSVLWAGKHVVLARPASLPREGWPELRDLLVRTRKHLLVYHALEFDSEYRTACHVASSGVLGDLVSVRSLRFRHALPLPSSSGPALQIPEPRWQQGLWESEALSGLSLLLSFHPHAVTRVYADADPLHRHLQILLEFQAGGRGHWEIDLASPSTFSTGWFLTGTQASFLADRCSRVTPEGEIVENPVEVQPTCQDLFYDTLAETLASPNSVQDTTPALSRLLAVFSAAQASAISGNWTEISSWE